MRQSRKPRFSCFSAILGSSDQRRHSLEATPFTFIQVPLLLSPDRFCCRVSCTRVGTELCTYLPCYRLANPRWIRDITQQPCTLAQPSKLPLHSTNANTRLKEVSPPCLTSIPTSSARRSLSAKKTSVLTPQKTSAAEMMPPKRYDALSYPHTTARTLHYARQMCHIHRTRPSS